MKARRVKPQLYDDDSDVEEYHNPKHADSDNQDDDQMSNAPSSSEDEDEEEEGEEEKEEKVEAEGNKGEGSKGSRKNPKSANAAISHISFATLAKAQASLLKDQQRRQRKPTESIITTTSSSSPVAKPNYNDGSHKPNGKPQEKHARASKNAPQEVSSKRAVTRKREVVEPATRQKARDPRFDSAVNGQFDEALFRRNYAFLDDYRNDEMHALKDEIRKTKDERRKEQIEKKLKSMESRKQSQQNKDQLQEVFKEHKKKERQLVKQGKKPFHLSHTKAKRVLLEKQFAKLSEKQLERTMEKKQKRKSQKERKNMPWERRSME